MAHFRQRGILRNFVYAAQGSAAPLFAVAALPILGLIGGAIDYSRASAARAKLQTSLDTALLAGVKDGSASWNNVAAAVFSADAAAVSGTVATPNFSTDGNGSYTASVSATVPTRFLTIFSMNSIAVAASSVALTSSPENSCILTLDGANALSDTGMNFGGAPSISLTGCNVRSNTSLNCNGHNGGATESIAAGTATGCSNPISNARVVPDIYTRLTKYITPLCGGLSLGVNWNATSAAIPSGVKTASRDGYTEYHVCGDLTLTGTGTLINATPTADSVIVIENGNLVLANNAVVSTLRTAIVMTGTGSAAGQIDFPNGNGQSATLSLSPPLDPADPWQGVAIYQNPNQTTNVSSRWGPGATFNADGLVYLPAADITASGIAASGNYQCSKVVTHTFDTNGNVNLNFAQTNGGCGTIGLKQWTEVPLHLTQ
jgi:Flp pilus assembly protein TadG